MKALIFSRLCLVGMLIVGLAVGLFIESSVWSPHILRGKELLNVGGNTGCEFNKSCNRDNECGDCDENTYPTCELGGGSATLGCYMVYGSMGCGDPKQGEDEENCPDQECSECWKCQ